MPEKKPGSHPSFLAKGVVLSAAVLNNQGKFAMLVLALLSQNVYFRSSHFFCIHVIISV